MTFFITTKIWIHLSKYLQFLSCDIFFLYLVLNTFSHIDAFWHFLGWWFMKTLLQNEKWLLMSNISFCHNVFNFFFLLTLSLIRQFCSRRLWTFWCNFFFCHYVFKKPSAADMRERVKLLNFHLEKRFIF